MLVVADSSPVNYLIRIGVVDVLPILFERVAVPTEVVRELSRSETPRIVQEFIANPPEWLRVLDPLQIEHISGIDAGEQAAICLALELKAEFLLIDDLDGRRAAAARHLNIVGSLGVLERAAQIGCLDLRKAITKLKATDFRVADELIDEMLRRHKPQP